MDIKEDLIKALCAQDSGISDPKFDLDMFPSGKLGGFIVSQTFDGMSHFDRQDLVWNYLDKVFNPEQIQRIIALVTLAPNEDDHVKETMNDGIIVSEYFDKAIESKSSQTRLIIKADDRNRITTDRRPSAGAGNEHDIPPPPTDDCAQSKDLQEAIVQTMRKQASTLVNNQSP